MELGHDLPPAMENSILFNPSLTNCLLSQPKRQHNLNTVVGLDTKMTLHTTTLHHRNSTAASMTIRLTFHFPSPFFTFRFSFFVFHLLFFIFIFLFLIFDCYFLFLISFNFCFDILFFLFFSVMNPLLLSISVLNYLLAH